MSFSSDQKALLAAGLDRKHVRQREQAGRKLSYIEGWLAIAEANRIFGFGEWSSETREIRCVAENPRKIGKADRARDGFSVSYIARVRVSVLAGDQTVVREGVGSGHGIDVDLGLAHESAIKESETDARKRALMTFGNPFGLALYDKDQVNVVTAPIAKPMTLQHMLAEIKACRRDADKLEELKAEGAFRLGFRHATKDEQAKILAALNPTEGAAA